ncbi:hypothetical protein BC938DRAFT_481196 [Jimgerdemannia flammicorona]|uniref:Uncharacterized protein n=1 Tax=Jimgerdemannia flammicorona TaxID=994334 RepID=A0A433QWY5_9FUNG|nr:hypothetical protein BC938DRAFT_481196 [Jimgerdemannia flammicorona]
MYQNHLCLLTLLKLDIFFFVGYAIQLITLMPGGGSNSIIEFTIAIPISVLMLVFGFRGLHKENKVAMAIFLTACVLSGPYFILRFVQIFSPVPPGALDPYSNSRKFLTFFISTTVFLLIVTLGYSIVQFKNFGHGLRKAREEAKTKHADQRPLEHVAVEVDAEERDLGSSKIEETRWTID